MSYKRSFLNDVTYKSTYISKTLIFLVSSYGLWYEVRKRRFKANPKWLNQLFIDITISM